MEGTDFVHGLVSPQRGTNSFVLNSTSSFHHGTFSGSAVECSAVNLKVAGLSPRSSCVPGQDSESQVAPSYLASAVVWKLRLLPVCECLQCKALWRQ